MYPEPSMLSYFSFFSAQSKRHLFAQKKERHVPGWDPEKKKAERLFRLGLSGGRRYQNTPQKSIPMPADTLIPVFRCSLQK